MRMSLSHSQGFPSSASAGFTLLEVLVTVLVLSIGLLGLAGLQTAGLRSGQSAAQRSAATQLAVDIIDRVRANPLAKDQYAANAAGSDDCLGIACTPEQMAGYDLAQWTAALAAQLPSGEGTVCKDSSPNDGTPGSPACDDGGNTFAVKIWWDDQRTGDPEKFQLFATSFQP
jgi:type IV pilus assembly protein PilV